MAGTSTIAASGHVSNAGYTLAPILGFASSPHIVYADPTHNMMYLECFTSPYLPPLL